MKGHEGPPLGPGRPLTGGSSVKRPTQLAPSDAEIRLRLLETIIPNNDRPSSAIVGIAEYLFIYVKTGKAPVIQEGQTP